ncbi:GDSL esterase/lipase At1g29660, partial [Aspergillus udagawae]
TNPLGNPELPGQTSDGGLHWIGSLTSHYNTSLTLSSNFAVGGATTDSDLVSPWNTSIPSPIDQVKLFSKSIASKSLSAPWHSCNTLGGIWMGINELGSSYARGDLDTLLLRIMNSYLGQLQILYNAGSLALTSNTDAKAKLIQTGPAFNKALNNPEAYGAPN